jgi:hypothetical protein
MWKYFATFFGIVFILFLIGIASAPSNPTIDFIYQPLHNIYLYINDRLQSPIDPKLYAEIQTLKQKQATDAANAIHVQTVNNVGYTFYLGQIDIPSASPLSDDAKNKITEILYRDNYPKKLLANTAIVVVNTLAIKPDLYIASPNSNLPVGDMSPEFLTGGGEYATYTDKNGNTTSFSVVFINKNIINSNQLSETLAHELGHHIGSTLTSADWTKYFLLRGIASGTPEYGGNWYTSPAEDFAEVYKNVVTGINIKTAYGFMTMNTRSPGSPYENTCGPIYDKLYNNYVQQYQYAAACDWSKPNYVSCITSFKGIGSDKYAQAQNKAEANVSLQNCRRDVMANPSKYPNDYQYGVPYKSLVGAQTKQFISQILSKQN